MNLGSTFVALETSGRLFGLDYQLLFDAAITAINVFILFLLLSVILFNPVRNMLKKRQDKITSDRETANQSREEALAMKAEYEEKLKAANKEAELILSDARKTAVHNEQKIIDEAKEEAARIYNDTMNSIAKEDPDREALQAAYSKAYAEFKETAQYRSLPQKDKDSKEKDIFTEAENMDEVEKEKRLMMKPKFDITG